MHSRKRLRNSTSRWSDFLRTIMIHHTTHLDILIQRSLQSRQYYPILHPFSHHTGLIARIYNINITQIPSISVETPSPNLTSNNSSSETSSGTSKLITNQHLSILRIPKLRQNPEAESIHRKLRWRKRTRLCDKLLEIPSTLFAILGFYSAIYRISSVHFYITGWMGNGTYVFWISLPNCWQAPGFSYLTLRVYRENIINQYASKCRGLSIAFDE